MLEAGMDIKGKEQLVVLGFARVLKVNPRILAKNSNLDDNNSTILSIDISSFPDNLIDLLS